MSDTVTVSLANVWGPWPTDVPLFLDFHVYDIPETMKLAIDNAPDNIVSISFGVDSMPQRWQDKVAEWCAKRNIEPVWWRLPKDGN